MARRTAYQRGFDAASIAAVAILLRINGRNGELDAKELFTTLKPDLTDADTGDISILREFNIIE